MRESRTKHFIDRKTNIFHPLLSFLVKISPGAERVRAELKRAGRISILPQFLIFLSP